MSKLTIRYANNSAIKPVLTVDGKEIKGEKHGKTTVFTYETDSSSARVRVFNVLEASSPMFFLTSLLFFVLSVFGIFDDYSDFKCRKVNFDASVSTVSDCDLSLTGRGFSKSEKTEAIKTECTGSIDVFDNKFSVDKVALRRTRIMTAVRVVLFLACIVAIIAMIVK